MKNVERQAARIANNHGAEIVDSYLEFSRRISATPICGLPGFLVAYRVLSGVKRRGKPRTKVSPERMAELLREEIETIIEGELADPRIGLANVTELLLANDGRSARVMIAVEGSEADAAEPAKACWRRGLHPARVD